MKTLILSDIHGNITALNAVLEYVQKNYSISNCILLGDVIDYGMHSNEVIERLQNLSYEISCNIQGNHENSIINDSYERFSSSRGVECAKYTKSILNDNSWNYIKNSMNASGKLDFLLETRKCLAVHASLTDIFWSSINASIKEEQVIQYQKYDYVFSGHSHLPHMFEKYFACDDVTHRNKKKTVFINPGSVGQPRNHNNKSQFVVLDSTTGQIFFESVEYDIGLEQKDFCGQVDSFYNQRLKDGV